VDVQIRNQGAAENTGIAQPAFSLWMSHGITVSLRGAVRWIRSPPVPQAALWGSCSCFCRAEVRDVTVLFCTWGGNAVLTLQSHISAKSRPLLAHTLFEQQNTTAALRRKKAGFFFYFVSLEKIIFEGKKLLHIACEERKCSIWNWPLSVVGGVHDAFRFQKVKAWNRTWVWGHLSSLSLSCFTGLRKMENCHWRFW